MPTEIYLSKANAPEEYETIDKEDVKDTDKVIEEIHEEAKTEEKENDKGEKEIVEVSPAKDKVKIVKRPVPLNDTNPLWAKNPSECTDEDYKEFYRKVFMDYKEPLFWIHLNMDYPVSSISRRSIPSMIPLKEPSNFTTIRYLSQIISKKSFRNS